MKGYWTFLDLINATRLAIVIEMFSYNKCKPPLSAI